MRRLVLALMSVVALLVLPVGAAAADTVIEHNVTETMHDVLPCVGDATITVIYNAVEHFSQAADGSGHGSSTQTGTFSAVMDAGGTSTGRFTEWDGFNVSADGSQATFTMTFSGTVKSGVGAGRTGTRSGTSPGPSTPTATRSSISPRWPSTTSGATEQDPSRDDPQ
jgi:hypothetical protein